MEDTVREGLDQRHRIDPLPAEVAWIEVDAEGSVMFDSLERRAERHRIVGDLGWVHLQGEADPLVSEDIKDRLPPSREVLVSIRDHLLGDRREGIEIRPDLRAGEAVDHLDAEVLGRSGCPSHLVGRP